MKAENAYESKNQAIKEGTVLGKATEKVVSINITFKKFGRRALIKEVTKHLIELQFFSSRDWGTGKSNCNNIYIYI